MKLMDQTNSTLAFNLDRLNVGGALRRQLESFEPQGVAWEIKPDGNPTLIINQQYVYQPDNAVAHVAREINVFLENHDPDLVVFFGLGLGLHLQFLRLKTKKPILIFEPSLDVLASVLPEIRLDVEDVTLITNTGHLSEAAGEVVSQAKSKMAVGAIIPYRTIFPNAFERFRTALQQVFTNIELHHTTRAEFSTDWVKQMGTNLPHLISSAPLHGIGNVFEGKPGILVGAGPSLDTNMEGRGLICAVHTAVMPLARAGIVPDIVVLLESQHLDHYFHEVQNLDQIILAPAPHTYPTHLNLGFKGILTISIADQPMADWFEDAYDIAPLKSGGSVACTAFSILHKLKCEPIVLVGMDTAFTNNRTHAGDAQTGCCRVKKDPDKNTMSFTYLDKRQEDGHWDAQTVPAWGGDGTVLTRPAFSAFRHWFESAGQTWASDRTLINATEGGARFQGFPEMRLADFLEQYAPDQLPITSWLDKGLESKSLLAPEPLCDEIRKEINIITEAIEVARIAEAKAGIALDMLHSRQLGTLQPILDKLAKNEASLQKLTLQTRLLNTMVGYRAMALSAEKPAGNDKVSMTIHSVEKSREISRLII